jgi:hypothetical protein
VSESQRVIEAAFGSPDIQKLSNNAVAHLLRKGVVSVRHARRELEASGAIPEVYIRVSRRGGLVNVSRTLENRRGHLREDSA